MVVLFPIFSGKNIEKISVGLELELWLCGESERRRVWI
jgi:hypothetical protein